jgi:hypothetical protein
MKYEDYSLLDCGFGRQVPMVHRNVLHPYSAYSENESSRRFLYMVGTYFPN